MVVPALAQEGHPLSGTWRGNWGPTPRQRTDVTLVLDWDGKNINGLINPGPEGIKLSKRDRAGSGATGLYISRADAKGEDGKPAHFVIDGKIQNLTAIRRSIVGT